MVQWPESQVSARVQRYRSYMKETLILAENVDHLELITCKGGGSLVNHGF